MFKFVIGLFFIAILAAAGFICWYFYMKIRFKTIGANQVGVVTGANLGNPEKEANIIKDDSGRYMKIIRGGGHRLGMFQSFDKISLSSFQLILNTPKVYTKEGVGLYGQAVATVKVADTIEGIVKYAEQFHGKDKKEIHNEIEEVLGGNLRAILSKMTVIEINSDRERFNEEVREIAQEQLDRMGFHITSLGLTDLKDDDGYLENLGRPEVARVEREAEIAEVENKRETAMKQAKVDEEVAIEKYQRQMSVDETRKEADLNKARILAQTEKERAIAEASYSLELEQRRLDIEKRKLEILEQEKANELKLREMERENEVKLQERQVLLEKQALEVRKQKADAEYYSKTKSAEALAESNRLAGEAEAEVIRKRAAAEVEALEARAEAMNRHKEVMITEKIIEMMPEYAKAISSSLSNVESIRILDGGDGKQIQSLPGTVTNMMANMNEGLGQMTGIDLNKIIENISKPSQHTNTTNYNVPEKVDLDEDENLDSKE